MAKQRTMTKCKYIDEYIRDCKSGKIVISQNVTLGDLLYIEKKLQEPGVWVDNEKIEKGLALIGRWWPVELFDWEQFIFALCHAFRKDGTLLFNKYIILMGRGGGKNGFIAMLTWYFSTPTHGIKCYNVDIVAISEQQAKTSFEDVWNMLEENKERAKRFFIWTLERIVNKQTKSYIKFNTSNAKSKDGKRTACIVFDEIHEDEDYSKIKVFTGSFGKKPHSRAFYITTQGYVRGGVLDQELDVADRVVAGEFPDSRLCPLRYCQDNEEEMNKPEMWHKANPSLKYLPELQIEMNNHYIEAQAIPERALDFMTKRMNLPRENEYNAVVDYSFVKETNREIPYEQLKNRQCIGAIDYAQVNDFASAGLWFRHGEERVWIEHTWICHKALKNTARKIKFPVQEAVDKGLVTIVYEDSINPGYLAEWFLVQRKLYHIIDIVGDDYRMGYVKPEFELRGLPCSTVRSGPITHAKIAPSIQKWFLQKQLIFGDNMTMRWYVRNTCVVLDPKGNQTFKKIEPFTRKTDGFFAMIHAATKDGDLPDTSEKVFKLPVITV